MQAGHITPFLKAFRYGPVITITGLLKDSASVDSITFAMA